MRKVTAQDLPSVIDKVRAICQNWNLATEHTVFLNGSRLEGFENRFSDVDIWLVSKGGSANLTSVPVFHWADELHFNLSAYTEDHILALANLVNSIAVDDTSQVQDLPINTLVRYYRVAVAAPVINPNGLLLLQTNFHRDYLAKLLTRWSHIRSLTSLRDAEELLADGMWLAACQATRRSVECAVDSHLAANGEDNPSLKWRFEKLERCFGRSSEVFAHAWQLKSLGLRSSEEYFAAAKGFVLNLLPSGINVTNGQPRLAASVKLFDIGGDRYLVQHKTHMYRLGDQAKGIVELVDGERTETEIAEQLAMRTNELVKSKQLVKDVLVEMRSHGLIASYPDSR